ncbi:MAG: aryl-sulfate sulfotransferase [Candidatus Asgardarchaeia archaeon]
MSRTKKKVLATLILLFVISLCLFITFKSGFVNFSPHEVEMLENGNVLIADGGGNRVIEIDREGNIVWEYSKGLGGSMVMVAVHTAHRLPNGNTLIVDTGNDRVIEVDRDGNIVWCWDASDYFPDPGIEDWTHVNDADRLPNGNTLISLRNFDMIIEVDRDGNIVWSYGVTGNYSILRHQHNPDPLPDGRIIISDSENNRIVEIDKNGTVLWEYRGELLWPRDADVLPNDHVLITDSANGRVIEIDREGNIVWEYSDLFLPYEADRLENNHTLIADSLNGRVIEVDENGNIVWEHSVPSHTVLKFLLIVSIEIWALYVFEVAHLFKDKYKLKRKEAVIKEVIKKNIVPFLIITLLVLIMIWPFKGVIRILFYITTFS